MSSLPDVLILTRSDIASVMAQHDYLEVVRRAFRAAEQGQASSPAPMHVAVKRGGFHAKGASISLNRDYVAVKVNGNFPANPAEFGLPTVQGAILLADASNGLLLAILDSIEVTLRRTAAASALAAQLLARPDSRTLLVCGCGEQGRIHVESLREVLPLERCMLWDCVDANAGALAREVNGTAVRDLTAASLSADVIACCTPAREPYLDIGMVEPGTFIAGVGADSSGKSEIAPRLMASSTVVTDVLHQCSAMGDLRNAIASGCMTEADVHAELGQVLTGAKPGRSSTDEITVFDSTGTALQDVAASAAIYERCLGTGLGQPIALGAARGGIPRRLLTYL